MNNDVLLLSVNFNKFGEVISPKTPVVNLSNVQIIIPQQFFHKKRTIEKILSHTSFRTNDSLFTFESNDILNSNGYFFINSPHPGMTLVSIY